MSIESLLLSLTSPKNMAVRSSPSAPSGRGSVTSFQKPRLEEIRAYAPELPASWLVREVSDATITQAHALGCRRKVFRDTVLWAIFRSPSPSLASNQFLPYDPVPGVDRRRAFDIQSLDHVSVRANALIRTVSPSPGSSAHRCDHAW
jgi:hypothetical protein